MKEKKSPQRKIDSYIQRVKRFEEYLKDNEAGKPISDLTSDDLKKYVEWCEANDTNPYQELWGIRKYYEFLGMDSICYSCNQVMQMIQLKKFKLKDFMTANQEDAKKLAKIGIKTGTISPNQEPNHLVIKYLIFETELENTSFKVPASRSPLIES